MKNGEGSAIASFAGLALQEWRCWRFRAYSILCALRTLAISEVRNKNSLCF